MGAQLAPRGEAVPLQAGSSFFSPGGSAAPALRGVGPRHRENLLQKSSQHREAGEGHTRTSHAALCLRGSGSLARGGGEAGVPQAGRALPGEGQESTRLGTVAVVSVHPKYSSTMERPQRLISRGFIAKKMKASRAKEAGFAVQTSDSQERNNSESAAQ